MMDSNFTTFSDIASDGSVVKLTTVEVVPEDTPDGDSDDATGPLKPFKLQVYDRLVLESRRRKESFRVKAQHEKEEALERRMQPEMKRQHFESGQWASEPMMMRPHSLPATLKAYTGIDATERKP